MKRVRRSGVARGLALVALFNASAVASQATSRGALTPEAATQQFLTSLRDRDTTSLRAVLHESMRLTTVMRRGDRDVVLGLPADDLVATVSRASGEPWNQSLRDPAWSKDGKVAALWSRYTFHRGDVPDHCGVIAIHFARATDGWVILHVTDTHETVGCG